MDKQKVMEQISGLFKDQMGLELSDILTIKDGKFLISPENTTGLSIASLGLKMDNDEHGIMEELLTAVTEDNPIPVAVGFD